jgi:hypothetical protein
MAVTMIASGQCGYQFFDKKKIVVATFNCIQPMYHTQPTPHFNGTLHRRTKRLPP